jgi:hypothetical protein
MKKTFYVLTCALCTLLVLPAAAQVPAYVPTDGLVGWWPFNGNANDESGNGNDGVVNGATLTEDRFGNAEKAYSFDGISNVINVPSNTSLEISDSITICSWVYRNESTFLPQGIFGPATYLPTSPGYFLRVVDNKLNLSVSQPYTGGFSNTLIQPNEWVYLVGTYNNNSVKTYVNGVLDNEVVLGPNNLDAWSSANPLTIGQEIDYASPWSLHAWNGMLDDIAIYNRALTEQEIQNLYTGTTPPPCVSLPSNLQQGLVGYWPFCGNANDESGNGNDGVVNGATLTEDRFGNAEKAYGFDGVDDNIVTDYSYPTGDQSKSLSVWVKMNSTNDRGWIVGNNVGCEPGTTNSGFGLFIGEEAPEIWFHGDGFVADIPNVISYTTTQWYHIVVTHDSSLTNVYVDGELIASENNELNTSDGNFLVGSRVNLPENPSCPEEWFEGKVDDIAIWNRALTPEEVQELYTLDACTFSVYDTLTVYETVFDTVYTYETIYDTVTTYVTVTDTLLIDITITGFEGQPSWLNTVTVFPNPASDHITIDYGNFALMAGYNTIITNAAGATVYSSTVNSQQVEIDINAWGAMGVYYMSVYDASGALVAVRHIVLE